MLLLSMILIVSSGCGKKNQPNTIIDNKSLHDVVTAIDDAFAAEYGEGVQAVYMATPINKRYLEDFCNISPEIIEEFAGFVSYSITNSDSLIAVKSKEGFASVVKAAFEKRLKDLLAQYEKFPVNHSYERALRGKIYVKGDYLFLIVVGIETDGADLSQAFANDVQRAVNTIDKLFYE